MKARLLCRPSSTSRGYTAVEVLMAMTVMAIGGAAVITMQKTSVTANLDARKADVANAIARTWVERLQRDAAAWTCPGTQCANSNLANAGVSGSSATVLGSVANNAGNWFLPTQEINTTPPVSNSPAFDILGRDVPLANADFCVNIRLWQLTPTMVRADVRVIWPIGILNSANGFCTGNIVSAPDPNTYQGPEVILNPNADQNAPVFHAIYVTTSIRETGN